MKSLITLIITFLSFVPLTAQSQSDHIEAFVAAAQWAQGKNRLEVKGKSYSLDCSGVIYALSAKAGLDVQSMIWNYDGNGVNRLYQLMEDHNLLSTRPSRGDLIFWDDSYDKNGNGKSDDPLTHVGIVTDISEDGLITFVHHNYSLGIVEAIMDPADPGNRQRNSAMRARSDGLTDEGGWSAGHLFKAYGRIPSLLD